MEKKRKGRRAKWDGFDRRVRETGGDIEGEETVCTRYWIKRGDHRVIVILDSWIIVEFNGVSGVC